MLDPYAKRLQRKNKERGRKEEGHKMEAELCTAGCRQSRKKWTHYVKGGAQVVRK